MTDNYFEEREISVLCFGTPPSKPAQLMSLQLPSPWAAVPKQDWWLEVMKGGCSLGEISLRPDQNKSHFVLGRQPDVVDVLLDNPTVSRRHCCLQVCHHDLLIKAPALRLYPLWLFFLPFLGLLGQWYHVYSQNGIPTSAYAFNRWISSINPLQFD